MRKVVIGGWLLVAVLGVALLAIRAWFESTVQFGGKAITFVPGQGRSGGLDRSTGATMILFNDIQKGASVNIGGESLMMRIAERNQACGPNQRSCMRGFGRDGGQCLLATVGAVRLLYVVLPREPVIEVMYSGEATVADAILSELEKTLGQTIMDADSRSICLDLEHAVRAYECPPSNHGKCQINRTRADAVRGDLGGNSPLACQAGDLRDNKRGLDAAENSSPGLSTPEVEMSRKLQCGSAP